MVDIAGTEQAVTNAVENVLGAVAHAIHAADGPPPLEVDDDGWIRGPGTACTSETLKRQSLAPGVDHIEGIVTHWTDTRGCGAMNLAKRLLDPDNDRAASWHLVIDAQGNAVQSVSAKHGSWHAGGAQAALFQRGADGAWTPLTPAQRGQVRGYGANSFAFGIELECAGEVRLVDGKWCGWPFAFGTKYGAPAVIPADEVTPNTATHGYHAFTAPQIETLGRVVTALVHRYGLRRDACALGHCQIDPENRTDPGPLMLGSPVPKWGATGGHLKMILDSIFGAS